MQNPNDQTIKSYRDNFNKYTERTPTTLSPELNAWMDYFCDQLPHNAKIFEFGSATGRDARYFNAKGFEVFCTDVIPEALINLTNQGFETSIFDFRNTPKPEWLNQFDGLFANAVFVHAKQETFLNALGHISKIVKKDGVIAFSLLIGEGEKISNVKIDAPRYFNFYRKEDLKKLLSQYNFEILSIMPGDRPEWMCVTLKNH